MLVFALVSCSIGVAIVAWGTRATARRLGLDPMAVALWLGLAERPVEPLPRRRRHVERRPTRRRLTLTRHATRSRGFA